MDKQEYEKFLSEIADKVGELVAVPENRKRFEQHSCDLGKKHAAYLKACKRGAKQMPLEPLSRFQSVLAYDKDNPDEPPRPKIDEALTYYYFSLATIHDKMRDEGYIPIHNDTYAKQLANTGVWPIIENLCVDKPFIIKTALDHVMADLAKKSAETGQTYTGIEAWKKFIEKLSEVGNLEIPLYPFKAGKIKYLNFTDKPGYLKYGSYRFSKDDCDVIENTVGFPLTISKLRAFLVKNCSVQDPIDYSWPDIIAALSLYRNNLANLKPTETKQDTVRAILRKIWTYVKRIPHWIYYLVVFLAALLTCLYFLGWLEPIKAFIEKIVWPE